MNSGDTAFVLISAAMVMFMVPGLALFYGGMVRAKNVLATAVQSFFALGLVPGLRTSAEEEHTGLDLAQHEEAGYVFVESDQLPQPTLIKA